ncbi:phosphate/phosphite/phosphonate ABC transporter substrate-binding protein [Methanolobus sp. ZRKC2]|uniref:phosphate/phosphite/phosphonate ABC transporter substrate-binding protein n=1 Tax=Methanolobus sp. ZRKC2 TaxID=3125783 RepID=UPI00324DE505
MGFLLGTKTKYYFPVLALITVLLLASGCEEKNDTEVPTVEIQNELKVGLILWDEPVEVSQQFSGVENYLSSELGMEVKTIKSSDYYVIIDAMEAGELDIAFFGPFSSVIAAERAGSEMIIAGANAEGNLDTYNSYIIVNKNTGISSIDELAENSHNLTFSFVDPASTSGNLIPRGYLLSKDINPDTDFKSSIFSSGHDITIKSVVSGNIVDSGAVASTVYERYFANDNNSETDITIIWKSDPIPPNPIVVRADMDPLLKEKIKNAFLDMKTKSPETFENFMDVRDGHATYMEVNNSDYEFIREMAIALGYI